MSTRFYRWLLSATVFFCLIFVATNVVAKKGGKPKPPPGDDPVISQPAFAYYGKANPNSGAIHLANADGSAPVKLFSTAKFQGDRFKIASFQGETAGKVLFEDASDLWRIDYELDDNGMLGAVHPPVMLFEGGGHYTDWSPGGDDFAFHQYADIYLDSRVVDYDSRNFGNPIVANSPSSWELDSEASSSLAWGTDGETLYFKKGLTDRDGPRWAELHKAEIGNYLGGGTQLVTQCLLATREAPYLDDYCSVIDENLVGLIEVSHSDDGLMVSAVGMDYSGRTPEEIYFIYILDETGQWTKIPTPEFVGHDWTPNGTIVGQTDDDEILEFDPLTLDVKILRNKATSPDWSN